jgi:hypothetical protein
MDRVHLPQSSLLLAFLSSGIVHSAVPKLLISNVHSIQKHFLSLSAFLSLSSSAMVLIRKCRGVEPGTEVVARGLSE